MIRVGQIPKRVGCTMYHTPQLLNHANCQIQQNGKKIYNLKNEMYLHMFKHCEFENHITIYANANCKQLRSMKRQNIANLYQKQKYAKYEFCKKIYTENLLCKPQTVQGKFSTIQFGTIQFGNRTIWYWTIWHQVNLAP